MDGHILMPNVAHVYPVVVKYCNAPELCHCTNDFVGKRSYKVYYIAA